MRKKFLKILLVIITIVTVSILIKYNVTAVKEKPQENKESFNTTVLEKNSELVTNLYESLNMDLISNTCSSESCLKDENYDFLYYKFENKKKTLSDAEKLYFVFNSLYRKNLFQKEELGNDEISLTIDVNSVKDELSLLFDEQSANFDSTFKSGMSCGIVDYLYTGTNYQLTLNKCENKHVLAKNRLIEAYKKDNYVYLVVETFLASSTKKDFDASDNVFEVRDFQNEEKIMTTSLNKILEDSSSIFDNYDFTRYTFRFELKTDNYYLKDIFLGEI